MSFLRALAPARRTTSYKREEPTLTLHVPAYGALYLTRSVQPFGQQDPGYVSEPYSLKGWVQVKVPASHGRCRCKKITVGFRTVCRLAMGPNRGWEEDVIFEREEILVEENGIWFEEGSTRYEFAFTLPDSVPPMDWHENAKIRHELYAVVEGIPPQSHGLRLFQSLRASSPSASTSRGRSPAPSRNRSPAPSRGQSRGPSRNRSPLPSAPPSRPPSPTVDEMSNLNIDNPSISLIHRATQLPQTPSYEDVAGEGHEGQEWLEGTFAVKRNIRVVWNPNPTGGVNSLDEKVKDQTDELGECEVQFKAPIWTVCCVLHIRVHFPQLPLSATIFYVRVDLVQTVVVRSPRDKGPKAEEKAVRTSRRHIVAKEGRRPPKDVKRPDSTMQAVRRGKGCEGKDEGDLDLVTKGRLPNDVDTRPSTLEGVETPAHVSHQLLVEIVYSIWGEDHHGQPLSKSGPGEQRTISFARSVFLPGCPNIPENVGLPEYVPDSTELLAQPNEPCPLCKTPPEDRYCTSCPFDRPVHPRHDHAPKLVGSADGVCPVCSVLMVKHEGDKRWRVCACALGFEEMERLGEAVERAGGAATVQRWHDHEDGHKDEYERGRTIGR